VKRRLVGLPVVRAAQRLTVDGNNLLIDVLAGSLDPLRKAGLKCLRIEQAEEPTDRVMGRYSVLQVQKLSQPVLLGLSEAGNGRKSVGAADHRADRHNDDLVQRIVGAACAPRIVEIGKVFDESHSMRAGDGAASEEAGMGRNAPLIQECDEHPT
jgi:hypothetical protein